VNKINNPVSKSNP